MGKSVEELREELKNLKKKRACLKSETQMWKAVNWQIADKKKELKHAESKLTNNSFKKVI